MAQQPPPPGRDERPPPAAPTGSSPAWGELIVVARADAGLRVNPAGPFAAVPVEASSLAELLTSEQATMQPLFDAPPDTLPAPPAGLAAAGPATPPILDSSRYYRVDAPPDRMEALADRLRQHPDVETAYLKPRSDFPARLVTFALPQAPAPAVTPDFTALQGYLDVPPEGVGARAAWELPGGKGEGVRIVDVEGGWQLSHEDLRENQVGVIGGTPDPSDRPRNHGTAVLGVMSGDDNGIGITGICPAAQVGVVSIFPDGSHARAIQQATAALNPGDIILIELHAPGPRFNFQENGDAAGYIPVEWWPDTLHAIWQASQRGVIVVEAAGNGGENLDDGIYDQNPPFPFGPFPSDWRNPFRRNPLDSNAILVGAGAPPPGTQGIDLGPDRSRLDFSNWGSMVDAQGWGHLVVTTGYGHLQDGSLDRQYMNQFGGTSSASPVVVGALACVQGFARANGLPLLTPQRARQLLRETGSPQQDAPGRPSDQRIGNRPDIGAMIEAISS